MHSLANIVKITPTITFSKENGHALRHIDAYEAVEIPDHCGQRRQCDSLGYTVVGEVFPAKGSYLEVEFDDECAVETLHYLSQRQDRGMRVLCEGEVSYPEYT